MDVMKKVPVREQAPDVRNKNFDEVCLGDNKEEAMEERGVEETVQTQRNITSKMRMVIINLIKPR